MDFLMGFLLLFPLFMIAVMVHEVSHGWVALLLGDPTAKQAGRLTFNPLRHIDPVGTLLLPIILLLARAPFVFGWAKPVPINPYHLRRPKQDMLWVGLAGPASNFILAAMLAFMLRVSGSALPELAEAMVTYLILINLVLGVFNLLPIPPLDGSRILVGLLPVSLARHVLKLERWGILIVFALIYFGILRRFLWPTVTFLADALGV